MSTDNDVSSKTEFSMQYTHVHHVHGVLVTHEWSLCVTTVLYPMEAANAMSTVSD